MLNSAPLGMQYILKALLHTATAEVLTKHILLKLLHEDGSNYFETRIFPLIYIILPYFTKLLGSSAEIWSWGQQK